MRLMAMMLAALSLAACSDKAEQHASNEPTAKAEDKGAAPGAQAADAPSFDCARADGQAQELVCSDKELAAMDREADRLFRQAKADPQAQRAWAKGRDECWKADELRGCVTASYAERIHRLRQASAEARAEAAGAISIGPVVYRCAGLPAPVAATYINAEPGAVLLDLGAGKAVTLRRAMSGSGARYEQVVDGQSWLFWNKGREARLTMPGKAEGLCKEEGEG